LKISKALAGKIINYRLEQKKLNPGFKFNSSTFISIVSAEYKPSGKLIQNIKEAISKGRLKF